MVDIETYPIVLSKVSTPRYPQSAVASEMSPADRGVAGKSFAGRQEVVALENYWIACKDLPMALVINSTMAT